MADPRPALPLLAIGAWFAASGCLAPYFGDEDGDGDGWAFSEDCDDRDPRRYPGAEESCDRLDNDCDGSLPESEVDGDGDGIAPCEGDSGLCDEDPSVGPVDADSDGVTTCDGDCNDRDQDVHPGHVEVSDDGVDNDCDGVLDPLETDDDGDGYSEASGDCDDADPTVSPGVPDIACGGVDEDCNGVLGPEESDNDHDGASECDGDCDDVAAGVSPFVSEAVCDGIDTDCDGALADEETDADGDGWTRGCAILNPGLSAVDCDDSQASAHPREADAERLEVCGNGSNDDCDVPLSGEGASVFADSVFVHDFDNAGANDVGPDQFDYIAVLEILGVSGGTFHMTRDEAGTQGRLFGAAPASFPAAGVGFHAEVEVSIPPGSPGFAVVMVPADPFVEDPGAYGDLAATWLGAAARGGGTGLGYAGLGVDDDVPGRRALAVAFRTGSPYDTATLEDGGPERTLDGASLPLDLDTGTPTEVVLDLQQDAAAGTVRVDVTMSRGVSSGSVVIQATDLGFPADAWYLGVTASETLGGDGEEPELHRVAITCD